MMESNGGVAYKRTSLEERRAEMAPRSHLHLTEVCAFASGCDDDLALLRHHPSLLASLAPRRRSPALALASASASASKPLILVLASPSPADRHFAVVARISPSLSQSDGSLAAVQWLPRADAGEDDHLLAVGTSLGYLLLYSLAGDLIHKQAGVLISSPSPLVAFSPLRYIYMLRRVCTLQGY